MENQTNLVKREQQTDLDQENDENSYLIEDKSIYTKNGLLIAKIVYQCIDCVHINSTINDIHKHYNDKHLNFYDEIDGHLKSNDNSINIDKNSTKTENLRKSKRKRKVSLIKGANNKANKKFNFDANIVNTIRNNFEKIFINNSNKSELNIEKDINYCDNDNNNQIAIKKKRKYVKVERGLYKITGKNFSCDECGKTYSTAKILRTHKRIHTNPVVCDYPQCNRQFAFTSLMKAHYRVHTNDMRYKCDWPGCDYGTVHQAGILAHKRTHTGERPYMCKWPGCGQHFCQQSSLNSHVSYRHDKTAVKRIKCEWPGCDMSFLFANELRKHHRTHTGERPFRCDWPNCDQSFASTTVLKRHKVTHTGERAYCCDWPGCDAKFGASGTLNTHKKLVHKCDYIKRSRWDNKKKKA